MVNAFFYLTLVLFLLVCLILILLVLIQKGRGGGLASAFGGGGGNTAFGSKTGDVLTWATSIVFGVFLLLAIFLNLLANASNPANAALSPANTSSETTGDIVPKDINGDIAKPNPGETPGPAPAAPLPTTTQTEPVLLPPDTAITAPPAPAAAPTTVPTNP
jgi:preprotein translocase subunit SecG